MRLCDSAGHDALEMREIGRDVDGHAVEGNPAADANAERGDLVFGGGAVERRRLVGPGDPDADAVLAGLADDAELGERIDQPALESADEGAHVGATAPEVEHDIGDALPGPVIGELAAAPGAMHGKVRIEQIAVPCAGSRRVERRMLEQPDPLRRASLRDCRRPRLHFRDRVGIGGDPRCDAPFHRRSAGRGKERRRRRQPGDVHAICRNSRIAAGAPPLQDAHIGVSRAERERCGPADQAKRAHPRRCRQKDICVR